MEKTNFYLHEPREVHQNPPTMGFFLFCFWLQLRTFWNIGKHPCKMHECTCHGHNTLIHLGHCSNITPLHSNIERQVEGSTRTHDDATHTHIEQ